MTLRRMLSRVVSWHTVGVQQILAALCQMGGAEQGYALDERRALYLSDFAWYKAFPLIAWGQNLIKDCLLFCSRSICLREITEDQTHNNHLMSVAIKLEKETSSEKNNN